ncbi:MAG: nucleoside deaminase [Alphaproteobacteria bacterium]
MDTDADFMARAFAQAKKSADEGGVPVGACLVEGDTLISEGHNRRQQQQAVIFHGETDCICNAGLYDGWSRCTIYTTLSPCMMCAGTIVQFGIPRVVIGDNVNFGGNEDFLRSRGVEVSVMNVPEMIDYFADWMEGHMDIWNGDIGK